LQAAQERPILDESPWQDPIEDLAERASPNGDASGVVCQCPFGILVEFQTPEVSVRIEAARILFDQTRQEATGLCQACALHRGNGRLGQCAPRDGSKPARLVSTPQDFSYAFPTSLTV
jgi:hypothetical protein